MTTWKIAQNGPRANIAEAELLTVVDEALPYQNFATVNLLAWSKRANLDDPVTVVAPKRYVRAVATCTSAGIDEVRLEFADDLAEFSRRDERNDDMANETVIDSETWDDFRDSLVHVSDVANEITYPSRQPNRAKCSYCGQWGEERHPCEHCGAPIDGEKREEDKPEWWQLSTGKVLGPK